MTGSSVFDYVHQQDHAEVAEQLGLGLTSTSSTSAPHSSNSGLASPSSAVSEDHSTNSTANPDGNFFLLFYIFFSYRITYSTKNPKFFSLKPILFASAGLKFLFKIFCK